MTIKNSLAQMVAVTILATSAVSFSSYNSAYGATDQGDAKKAEVKKNASPSLSFVRGGTKEVCKEVYKLLQLPENSSYVSDYKSSVRDYQKVNTLFFIPSDNKEFSLVEWTRVPESEFQTALPMRYDNAIDYAKRYPEKALGIKSINRTQIKAFNDNKEYPIYEVSLLNGTYRKYIQMPSNLWGYEKFFDDELDNTIPFFFKGEVYFSALRGNQSLNVWRLTMSSQQDERICSYKYIAK